MQNPLNAKNIATPIPPFADMKQNNVMRDSPNIFGLRWTKLELVVSQKILQLATLAWNKYTKNAASPLRKSRKSK